MFDIKLGWWDVLLVVVAAASAMLIAYTYDPKLRALIYGIPTPFTVGVLALGLPMQSNNVLSLVALPVFVVLVRCLHVRLGVCILPAIIVSALYYCGIGAALNVLVHDTDAVFWSASVGALILAIVLRRTLPERRERDTAHRCRSGQNCRL